MDGGLYSHFEERGGREGGSDSDACTEEGWSGKRHHIIIN